MAKNKKPNRKAQIPKQQRAAPKPTVTTKPLEVDSSVKNVLHVGCGAYNPEKLPELYRKEGWKEIRLDIDESVEPDVVSSMTDMHAVSENSMDALFSSHNVEHLYRHQVQVALKEFHRVIKPGGQVMITLPDIQAVSSFVADGVLDEPLYQSPAGPIAPVDILYGWTESIARGNHYMAHKTGFTAKTLAQHMLRAGFSNVVVSRRWLDLWAVGYKLPDGHPKKVTQARIVIEKITGPKGQRFPMWYERKLLLEADPEARTDELDTAPRHWQPLGLK